ncbi:hypothetical protein [Streptomyces sp. NPDC003023]|uniref:hypothetical protein n=1 Tax=Streptomyces sp. NPDC003023 TaxID=3364675 RepID=UPI0036CE0C3E
MADQIRKRASRADAACGARLDRTPGRDSPLGSEDLNELLALQQRLDQSLDPAQRQVGSRQPVDPSFFPDLVMATHLIKLSWPAGAELLPSDALASLVDAQCAPVAVSGTTEEGSSANRRHVQTRPAPPDAAQCGALLLAADTLLGSRELTSLHERVQPLAREAYGRQMRYLSKILSAADISVTLARAAARRVYGHSNRAIPRMVPTGHRYRVEEVPPALPQPLFDAHFAPLIERLPSVTYEMQRYLRRAASLRVLELISGRTWRQCAPALDIPESSARQTLNVLGRAFASDGLWPVFEDAVDRVAEELDVCDARVDYAKRRQLMAQWYLPKDITMQCARISPNCRSFSSRAILRL